MEIILGLVCFAVVLVFIAFVGHGLWVLGAAAIRELSGAEANPSTANPPRDQQPFALSSSHRDIILRQLNQWRDQGLLTRAHHAVLAAGLEPPKPKPKPPSPPAKQPDVLEPIDADVVDKPVPKEIHPLDKDYKPAPAGAGPALQVSTADHARRAFTDVLASFMEESNIRWGEVVAGLLIVGSAIGCVISLRETINQAGPYAPASVFMLGICAIFGAGMYTLKRWNLQSISRAVLIITLLLVPLNFLLATKAREAPPVGDPIYWLAVAVGLSVFGAVVYFAARELTRGGWRRLTLGVTGASACQLFIGRLAAPDSGAWGTSLLAAGPLACFLIAIVLQTRRTVRWKALNPRRVEETCIVAGVSLFAVCTAFALLILKLEDLRQALAWMSPAVTLAAAAVIGWGLALASRASSPRWAPIRTASLAVAICGGLLMTVNVAFAWPQPNLLILVGVLGLVSLSSLAIIARQPILHMPATICAALAWIVTSRMVWGERHDAALDVRIGELLWTGHSSLALTILSLVGGAAGLGLDHWRRREDAFGVWIGAALLGAAALISAFGVGFFDGADAALATPVLAIYALGSIVVGVTARLPLATAFGVSILAPAMIHGFALNAPLREALREIGAAPARPVLFATLCFSLTSTLLAVLFARSTPLRWWVDSWLDDFPWSHAAQPLDVRPLARRIHAEIFTLAAVVGGGCALGFALYVKEQTIWPNVGYLSAITLVALAVATLHRSAEFLTAFQALATITLVYGVAAACQTAPPWRESLLRPLHLHAQFAALAVWAAAWCGLRRWCEDRRRLPILRQSPRPLVDQWALGLSIIGLLIVASWGCAAGIGSELGASSDHWETISGRPHLEAVSWAAWLAFGLILFSTAARLAERVTAPAILALVTALAAAPLLIAALFEQQNAVASALRWSAALYAAAGAAVVCCRRRLFDLATRTSWVRFDDDLREAAPAVRLVSFGLPLLITFGITLAASARTIAGDPVGQPVEGSLFAWMGPSLSYAGPLFILAGVLLAYAASERRQEFAIAGSVLFQISVTLLCVVSAALDGPIDPIAIAVSLLQWNAVGLGVYSLIWLALHRRISSPDIAEQPSFLRIQLAATWTAVIILGSWAAAGIFISPRSPAPAIAYLGSELSYLSWALAASVCAWALWRPAARRNPCATTVPGILTLSLGAIIGATVTSQWPSGNFAAAHGMQICWGVAASVSLVGMRLSVHWRRGLFCGAAIACGLSIASALRIVEDDARRVWFSAAPTVLSALVMAGWSTILRRRDLSYVAAAISIVSGGLLGYEGVKSGWLAHWSGDESVAFLQTFLLGGVAAGVVAAAWNRQRSGEDDARHPAWPAHVSLTLGCVIVFGLLIAATFASKAVFGSSVCDPMSVITAAAITALAAILLWDRNTVIAVRCLYVMGAVWLLIGVDSLSLFAETGPLTTDENMLAVLVAAASYVAFTGWLWRAGIGLAVAGRRLGIPDPVEGLKQISTWLPGVNLAQAAPIAIVATAMVLLFDLRSMRYLAAMAPLLAAVGVAGAVQQQRRALMQHASLTLAALAAVLFAWADVDPAAGVDVWLTRLVRTLIVLSALAAALGIVVTRGLSGDHAWHRSLRTMTAMLGAATLATLAVTLLLEAALFRPGIGVEGLQGPQIAVVAGALIFLIAALLLAALTRDRKTFSLTDGRRMACVYAAEIIGGLLFAHLYLTMPWIFAGFFKQYWAWVVVALAFVGVGVGEFFKRSGIKVLAEPLAHTGAFLPLLPVASFFAQASLTEYAGLLFWVGLLYLVISVQRRSFVFAAGAALAGNGALWAMMQDRDFTIMEHPQFWLIPPAVSMLAAAQLTRDRLSESQIAAIRYACLLTIYLSSTGEMFIHDVGRHLWPAMALMALSVLGILLGIAVRVRAFLFLGMGFLLLSLISMVWHASARLEHSWPWWAFAFMMGVALLTMFGLFEKRRDDFLRQIERVQQWES